MAFGATLAGAAPAVAQDAASLKLAPARALVDVNRPIRFTAHAVDADNRPVDNVNQRTRLSFDPDDRCAQDAATDGILVLCRAAGTYTVVGVIGDPQVQSEPVTLEVVAEPVPPKILSVRPRSSPPNREVVVKGTTGSCNQSGTLTLEGIAVGAQPVTGVFSSRLTVLPGTFPGRYPVELSVDCDRQPQLDRRSFRVRNRPPTAADDAETISGPDVTIDVTDNDTDPDGDDGYRTVVEPGPPLHGTAVVQDQAIVYRPGAGFVDRDQFIYRHCDVVDAAGKRQCGTGTVTVARPDPVPEPDRATTAQGQQLPILVTENDSNPNPAKLRVRTDPRDGEAVARDPRDGHIVYTPRNDFTGTDHFEYDYCEGVVVGPSVAAPGTCPSATVTVTVEPPKPEAVDDPDETTEQGRHVDIDVMGNDKHPVAAWLRVKPEPVPEGTAVVQSNGTIRYTPRAGFTGEDSFDYDYCEPVVNLTARAVCDPATVTVDVTPRTPPAIETVTLDPTPPSKEVVVTGTTGSCNQAGTLILHISQGANDPVPVTGAFEARLEVPGGTFPGPYRLELEVRCRGTVQAAEKILRVANKAPDAVDDSATTTEGTAVPIPVTDNDTDPDGDDGYKTSLDATKPARGRVDAGEPDKPIVYTPDDGFTGEDRFTYRFCDIVDGDGAKDCDTATVTVTVRKREPVPVDDPGKSTLRDQPLVIDVMENDTDPDASLLQVRQPARPDAKAEEQADGTVLYTPEAGFTGVDTFRYDYCGGSVDVTAARGACPSATVTVTVTDIPVISSVEPASTPPGKPVEVAGNTGSCNRAGTLELQGTGVVATVTADQDGAFTTKLTVLAGTFPGAHRLELRVDCRGQLQRAEAFVTVTNRAPVAADDSDSTTRDQAVRIRVTGNDRDPDDPDGYRALVLVTSQPSNGTAQEQPDLTVVYTPRSGFVGTDRFRYSLCDDVLNAAGRADCGTATVTVAVTDVPVILSVEPGSTSPGRPVRVVGNTGSCNRAGTLAFSGAAEVRMDVTGDQNGGFTTSFNVPEGTFPRVYPLELAVDCNRRLQRAEAELTVANQAPVAADDAATTTPDASTAIEVTGNDRDPDDPDGYRTMVLVTDQPDHGTGEAQPDLSIVYTPEGGFVGEDRFRYSLCDDVLNAAGQADCGTATVTVKVSPTDCAPSGNADPRLQVDPGRGRGGTRLRITATVDRGLATCQLRLLLGGTPLAPDVSVGDDGSISADRGVPGDAKPGPTPVRLATMTAQTLDEIPFEIVDGSPPPPWPLRLALGVGALLAGALARVAFRRWRPPKEPGQRRLTELADDVRAEPHARPVEAAVEPVDDRTRTVAVRLEPHPDAGTQTLEEMTR